MDRSISMGHVLSVWIILFRWIHITTACVAVGGVFFLRVVFPVALRSLDAAAAQAVLLRTRRIFKMIFHTCVLLLLISGSYNATMNWDKYTAMGATGQSLFGIHLLLGLIVFSVAFWLLAGREVKKDDLKWMAITLVFMFLTVAAGSVLKYARDSHAANTNSSATLAGKK